MNSQVNISLVFAVKGSLASLIFLVLLLADTILIFTKNAIHVLGGQKKVTILEQLKSTCAEKGLLLELHLKSKLDGGVPQMKDLITVIRKSSENPIIGMVIKERPSGKFAENWADFVSKSEIKIADIGHNLGLLMSSKDPEEILCIKKAAFLLTNAINKTAIKDIENTIDQEKEVTHSVLTDRLEAVIIEPSKIDVRLKKEMVDIAYPPIFESGGEYNLKISGGSSNKTMDYGVIVCQAGARYGSYCANIGRTYFVNPTKEKEKIYNAVLEAENAAIQALVEGSKVKDVYAAAIKSLNDKEGTLASHLAKNVGTAIGLEIRDNSQSVSPSNETLLKAGMSFNIVLALNNLIDESSGIMETSRRYAILISDTVVVPTNEKKLPEVLTIGVPKDWREIAYYVKDEDSEQSQREAVNEPYVGNRKSSRTERIDFREKEEERKRQKENQEALLEKVNQATLSILDKTNKEREKAGGPRKVTDIMSYNSISDVRQGHHFAIQVDNKNETVLLPMYGVMVPFHILTVKNASATQENDHYFIRVNFNFGSVWQPGSVFPKLSCIKEISFRTSNANHATSIVRDIKTLRSLVLQRDREKAERATLVKQEKITLSKNRMHVLKELWMRPAFVGKGRKMAGHLEAHANGFRYKTPKGEELDVMYRNIKHAFFQPAENDMMTLIHFRLINPIMIGKKKSLDVQFFTQVMDTIQTLDAGRRSMYDPDEIEEEQRERERRNQVNKDFSQFIKRVQQDIWEKEYGDLNLEFEIPFRELGFYGVPSRSTSFVMPTVNCLVELTEMPFTVIALSEVNLVNLERVGFNLRNFDMIFIWKDINKEVARIDTVPSQSLETIKDWLTSIEMKYYESKVNLNWKNILKSIKEDPEGFVESGGWNFLDGDQTDSEEEAEEESEFEPSVADDDEESDDLDTTEDESVVESDEDEFEPEDDDDDNGMDWDELEMQARREDRERGYSDSDEEQNKRRRK